MLHEQYMCELWHPLFVVSGRLYLVFASYRPWPLLSLSGFMLFLEVLCACTRHLGLAVYAAKREVRQAKHVVLVDVHCKIVPLLICKRFFANMLEFGQFNT
jgi:hypothetical protein